MPTDGRITTANAKEMAARSHAAKQARAEQLQATVAAAAAPAVPADYVSIRLARTREHVARLDAALEAAKDALEMERIARALSIMQEQERKLAGRPDPGSFRPSAPRSPNRAPIEPL